MVYLVRVAQSSRITPRDRQHVDAPDGPRLVETSHRYIDDTWHKRLPRAELESIFPDALVTKERELFRASVPIESRARAKDREDAVLSRYFVRRTHNSVITKLPYIHGISSRIYSRVSTLFCALIFIGRPRFCLSLSLFFFNGFGRII